MINLLTIYLKNLLNEKWYNTYYPTLVSPEAAAIEKLTLDYYKAINARDPIAITEIFPYQNEEEKQKLIELFKYIVSLIPEDYSIEVTKVEVEFVLGDVASAIIEIKESIDGVETVETITGYFTKINGKWMFGNDSFEDE